MRTLCALIAAAGLVFAQDDASFKVKVKGNPDKGFVLTCTGKAKSLPDGAILKLNVIRRMHYATWVETTLREKLSDEKVFYKMEVASGGFETSQPVKAPGLYDVELVFTTEQDSVDVSDGMGTKYHPFEIKRALRLGAMSDLTNRLPTDVSSVERYAKELEALVNAVNVDSENKEAKLHADKANEMKSKLRTLRETSLMSGALMVMQSLADATYNSLAFEGRIAKDATTPKHDGGGTPPPIDPNSPMGNDMAALQQGAPPPKGGFTLETVKVTLTYLKDVIGREVSLTLVELLTSVLEDAATANSEKDEIVKDLQALKDLNRALYDSRADYKGLVGDTMTSALDTLLTDATKTGDISAPAAEIKPQLQKLVEKLRPPAPKKDK